MLLLFYYFEKKNKNETIALNVKCMKLFGLVQGAKCQGNEKMKKHFHIYILDDEE
jgi:hypothetical protein